MPPSLQAIAINVRVAGQPLEFSAAAAIGRQASSNPRSLLHSRIASNCIVTQPYCVSVETSRSLLENVVVTNETRLENFTAFQVFAAFYRHTKRIKQIHFWCTTVGQSLRVWPPLVKSPTHIPQYVCLSALLPWRIRFDISADIVWYQLLFASSHRYFWNAFLGTGAQCCTINNHRLAARARGKVHRRKRKNVI